MILLGGAQPVIPPNLYVYEHYSLGPLVRRDLVANSIRSRTRRYVNKWVLVRGTANNTVFVSRTFLTYLGVIAFIKEIPNIWWRK